jgi:hypothetical protein
MLVDPILYNRIFARDNDGKLILEELCALFYDKKSYVKGDSHDTAFNEGRRDVVRFLLHKTGQTLEDKNVDET